MGIRKRLLLGSLALVGLSVIMGGYLSYQLNAVTQNTIHSIEKPLQAINIASTAWNNFRDLKAYVSTVLLRTHVDSSENIKTTFLKKFNLFCDQLKLLQTLSRSDSIDRYLTNIFNNAKIWKTGQLQIVAGENLLELPVSYSLLVVERKLETELNKVVQAAIDDAAVEQKNIKAESSTAIQLAIALVIITAIVALLLARSFSLALILPLNDILNFMNDIINGTGNLSKRIEENSSITEYKTLEKIFNHMLEKIENNQQAIETALNIAHMANKTKTSFVANMSHELRTPLTTIIGYSELIEEYTLENNIPECRADAKKILSAGNHLLGLVNDVLDISKIEAGKMEVTADAYKVEELLNDVVQNTENIIKINNNTLKCNISLNVGGMISDRTKFLQILLNLVSNAAKFTQNGTITILCQRTNRLGSDWIKVNVIDSGIGMSDAQLTKIFQEFVQADSSTTKRYGGTGLGLAISKNYCELIGGRITVSSKINCGTNFCIEIPAEYRDKKITETENYA